MIVDNCIARSKYTDIACDICQALLYDEYYTCPECKEMRLPCPYSLPVQNGGLLPIYDLCKYCYHADNTHPHKLVINTDNVFKQYRFIPDKWRRYQKVEERQLWEYTKWRREQEQEQEKEPPRGSVGKVKESMPHIHMYDPKRKLTGRANKRKKCNKRAISDQEKIIEEMRLLQVENTN